MIAGLNRSDYADSTKHTFESAVKKFYKVNNGGHEHPEKVQFFSVSSEKKSTSVTGDSEDNFIYMFKLDNGDAPDIHFRRADLKKVEG